MKIPALDLQPIDEEIRYENIPGRHSCPRPLPRIRCPAPMRKFIATPVRKREWISPLAKLTEIL